MLPLQLPCNLQPMLRPTCSVQHCLHESDGHCLTGGNSCLPPACADIQDAESSLDIYATRWERAACKCEQQAYEVELTSFGAKLDYAAHSCAAI